MSNERRSTNHAPRYSSIARQVEAMLWSGMHSRRCSSRAFIGLLGGSFNPAHAGHVHLSLEAIKHLGLDEVWWLVSPQNPLKSSRDMAPLAERVQSAKALITHKNIRITALEQQLRTRYTVDTVKALQAKFPHTRFVWLMGADNLAQFHRWKKWREILHLLPLAVFDRAPFSHNVLRQKAAVSVAASRVLQPAGRRLFNAQPPAWVYIYMRKHAASASEIRKSLGKYAHLAHNKGD